MAAIPLLLVPSHPTLGIRIHSDWRGLGLRVLETMRLDSAPHRGPGPSFYPLLHPLPPPMTTLAAHTLDTLEQREGAVLSVGDVGCCPQSLTAQDGTISLTSVTSGAHPVGCL